MNFTWLTNTALKIANVLSFATSLNHYSRGRSLGTDN